MRWFLYLIECQDGSIYTGIAIDVTKRFVQHSLGKGAKYTRSHPPKQLLKSIPFKDRSCASKAEYAVKRLSAEGKRKLARSSIKTASGIKRLLNQI